MNLNAMFHDPLFILGLGIVTVVGLIVVLRVNAFLSLLAAAFLVSFMTPIDSGDWGDKVLRVANGFGTMAGKITIFIAMGSIIGKCMIDSGSADRIIRALRSFFGERLIPASLISGGFVLSIPLFYESTFYLMAPIARSVYRAVKKNYLPTPVIGATRYSVSPTGSVRWLARSPSSSLWDQSSENV